LATSSLDTRKILTGSDGELYDDKGSFLAQVNTWQAQLNFSNTDYNPAGQKLTVSILQNYSVTLTFTEALIRDAALLKKLFDGLKSGAATPLFGFQGVLRGHDGTTGRYVFRSCVPEGNIDMANVQPGQILERQWSFRVNEPPSLQSLLGG
jgi:hypothetical protein